MTIHKPQDRVLTWVLPWFPTAIAFALLCVLLLLSERIVVSALQPVDAALAPVQRLRRQLLAWGGSITVLLAFTGFWLSGYLARRQQEHRQRLREQGQLLSAAINSASDAIVSVDLSGRITQFNPAAAHIFGHPASAMLGQPLDTLLPQVPRLDLLRPGATSTGPMGIGRVTGVRANGQALDLEASVSHLTVRGTRMVTTILRDVTERVRTERALAQHQLALTELTHRLLQQEKQTTRKLAQTLHDQLGQTVGAMRLSFDALINMIPEPLTPKLKDRGRALGQLIDTANAQVRQALVALRPPLLDEDGLQAALRHEVHARAADAEPVVLHLEVAPLVARTRWPADVEHAAFMVAREAMANALLHAGARSVVLRVDGHNDQLHLSVTDDGVGLNADMAAGRPGHLGIVGMRERALAIGARLHANSLIEGGTVVSLTWEASSHPPSPTRHTQDTDCATPPHHE
ncbi:PAS domain S-box protein [Hydrogenophaga sp. 2FB]|uniref:sensor histidine kinase n=1 Tax=Hydrogenophaga sp. 2FB TaxID=2502187 RepID=UPI001484FE00|nr:PAS domain S-box protein [Hydrogenophaga sp. 2FB]